MLYGDRNRRRLLDITDGMAAAKERVDCSPDTPLLGISTALHIFFKFLDA